MAIVRYSPGRGLAYRFGFQRTPRLLDEVERFMDELWPNWPTRATWSPLHPAIDMIEAENDLVLRVELPGVSKDDIEVSIQGSMLTLKAEKKAGETKQDYYMCERTFGTLHRTIELPLPVESDKASASWADGVLEIRLPKAEEVRTKQVKVTVK
ncbi:MAG: Hsp20/alpha crystallin family protein [Chloroflexi bacterium]|nr:Hsp20/alpha crystallin family protein [Chloroflexota bacterium]